MTKIKTKERIQSGISTISLMLTLGLSVANAQLPGLTVERNTTAWTSVDKTISVTCPLGTVPIGTGYQIGGSLNQGHIHVTEVRPTGTRSVIVSAVEGLSGFTSNWNLQAIAICAEQPSGWQKVSATANSASNNTQDVIASCPYGKELVGTGAEIINGGNQVMLTAVEPTSNSVYVAAQEDVSGTANLWSVTAHAFCADPLSGLDVIESVSGITTADNKFVSAECPVGTGILGVGGSVENIGMDGDVSLFHLNPVIYQGRHLMYGRADETAGTMNSANLWQLHGFIICADL